MVESGVRAANQFWPNGAPKFIQNMFYGPYSDFSFVRMSGYTILGAMLGFLVRKNEVHVRKWWFGLTFIIGGLLLAIWAKPLLLSVDDFIEYLAS